MIHVDPEDVFGAIGEGDLIDVHDVTIGAFSAAALADESDGCAIGAEEGFEVFAFCGRSTEFVLAADLDGVFLGVSVGGIVGHQLALGLARVLGVFLDGRRGFDFLFLFRNGGEGSG